MIHIGNKKSICIVLVIMLTSITCTGSMTVTAEEWLMFRHDPQHTGVSTSFAPEMDSIWWDHQINSIRRSSPAFGKGRLFIGSTDGNLYCFDAEPSERTDEGVDDPPHSDYDLIWTYATGGSILSSPAFSDGKIYVGSQDGTFYCVYACIGTEVWNASLGSAIRSSPAIINDQVYIGAQNGNLYCFNATTGNQTWENVTGGSVVSSPAVAGKKVFVGSDDCNVYCLNATTGAILWTSPTSAYVRSSPSVVNGKVYVGSDDYTIYCLKVSDGSQVWNFTTGGMVRSSPAVADGKVYIGSDDYHIYCLNAGTGIELWNYSTQGIVRSSPAIADEKLYIGSNDGLLYCISTNGTSLWNYSTGDIISSSPAIEHMRAYVASENGNITCFRDHKPPDIPDQPIGPTSGVAGVRYRFESESIDHEGDQIYYQFDWGDGNRSKWLGPFAHNESVNTTYVWADTGTYNVTVRANDSFGLVSNWSEALTIYITGVNISRLRGGIGIHAVIKNVGQHKLWFVEWKIQVQGGLIYCPKMEDPVEGDLQSLAPGDIQRMWTGPFFQIGKINVTMDVTDKYGENTISMTRRGFAFGYFVILFPPL